MCTCTGHAGSYENVCCCNYYYHYCCRFLHYHCCCYCCCRCHLCCWCCYPSLSSAPLLRSSQSPEVLPVRASGGQSCTTASFHPQEKAAGELSSCNFGCFFFVWLDVPFKVGSENGEEHRQPGTCHPSLHWTSSIESYCRLLPWTLTHSVFPKVL